MMRNCHAKRWFLIFKNPPPPPTPPTPTPGTATPLQVSYL